MKSSDVVSREKWGAFDRGRRTRTAEGGEHQVVYAINECHVQAQDEADETVGQKHDRS